jgi:hypothetical protein
MRSRGGPRGVSCDPGLRRLQLVLAALWAIDALLALQPENFTSSLVFRTILGNAENQPQPIFGSLVWASHLLGPYPVELNVAIIVVQLLIATGLLWPRTVKPALALSVAWALGVWWLGEGFGGVFAGKATLLVGAPGPALLYAILALVAWPVRRERGSTVAAAGALGERATRGLWALLWVGGAIFRVVPFWFSPVYALSGDFELGLNEEPHWLFRVNETLSHLAATAGLPLVIAVATLEAIIGFGVLTRHRRVFLVMGMVLAGFYWVFGQQLAELLTGQATDVAAGPLYVVLALTLWPRTYGGEEARRGECRGRANRAHAPADPRRGLVKTPVIHPPPGSVYTVVTRANASGPDSGDPMNESTNTEMRPADGAVQELARDDVARKKFLKMAGKTMGSGAAAAGLAAFIAACGGSSKSSSSTSSSAPASTTTATTSSSSASASSTGDLAIVNYALTLEYLEAQFYDKVIASGLFNGSPYLSTLKTFGAEEHDHVAALHKVAMSLGTPASEPTGKFPLTSAASVTKLAATVENLGAAAYLGQAPNIKSKEILAAALAIHTVEGRHAATLNLVLKMTPTPDGAFAKPMTMSQVLAVVKPFIA